LVLIWAIVTLVACLGLVSGLGQMRGLSLDVPGSSSARATALLAKGMPEVGTEQLLLAFNSRTLHAEQKPYQRAVTATVQAITAAPGAPQVLPLPDAPGRDPHHSYLLLGAHGDADARQRLLPTWQAAAQHAAATASSGQVSVALTGMTPVLTEISHANLRDLQYVEAVTLPVALLLLVLGLGSIGSALVTLLAGALSVVVSAGALAVLARWMPLDSTAITVATTVGFGLGLDYALLFLLRYRRSRIEQLAPHPAAAHTSKTAGRAVLWCAGAVLTTSMTLLAIPLEFVRTMGVAAGLTAVVTAAVVTTVLPAALPRLDGLLVWGRVRRTRPIGGGLGKRWVRHLMRRPWPYLLAAVAVLAVAAAPAADLRLGLRVDRAAIANTPSGQGLQQLERDGLANNTLIVLPHRAGARPVDTSDLADTLRADPRISSVGALDNGRDLTVLAVADHLPVDTPGSGRLVEDIRTAAARTLPPGQQVFTGGIAATLADIRAALNRALWTVAALAVAASFVLMLIVFRSVLIPLKALLMNALSTTAAFGLLAWFTRHTNDTVNLAVPLLTLTVVFGLSLDYEVFLVHRITEHYRTHGDCQHAIARGLTETAQPITLAAATMATVFAGLMVTHRQDLQQTGCVTALAVLLDVTLIRLVIVPTLMQLLGHRNWWLPTPLHRLLRSAPPSASDLPRQRPEPTSAQSVPAATSRPEGDPT
jgi:RND superfamily putative drug exporter